MEEVLKKEFKNTLSEMWNIYSACDNDDDNNPYVAMGATYQY